MGTSVKRWAAGISVGYAALLAILVARVIQQPLQAFEVAKVPFVQHGIRLRLLAQLEGHEGWNLAELWAIADSGDYAPGVQLASYVWGAFFGHGVQAAVLSQLVWMSLLMLGVGAVVRRLGGPARSCWTSALFVALIPGVHGAATVYQYDIPMLAALWLTALVLLPRPGFAGVPEGLRAGFLATVACVLKWSALPFGPPFALGALLTGGMRHKKARLIAASVALVTAVGLVALLLQASDSSLQATLRTQVDTAASEGSVLALRHKVSDLSPRLSFLGVHFISSVLSPLLALPLLALAGVWALRNRRGWVLFAVIVVGGLGFVLGIAADVDERFLVPAATALAAAAAMGVEDLPRRFRGPTVAVVTMLGLLVALDFHHAPEAWWNRELVVITPQDGHRAEVRLRGMGAVSSVEALGWNRRDETPDVEWDFLAAVQAEFATDPGKIVLVSEAVYDLGVHSVWFEFEHLLAYNRGGRGPWDDYSRSLPPCDVGSDGSSALLLTDEEPFPDCLEQADWVSSKRIGTVDLFVVLFERIPRSDD
jgi:hypothetical protein